MSRTEAGYVAPESVDDACAVLDEYGYDAKVMAGGQSLSLLLRQNLLDPTVIVDISEIPALAGITATDEAVSIGATTTYNELRSHEITAEYGCLDDAVSVIADEQIRNQGTIGGAVAHADPSLDVLPPLLCLNSTVTVIGPDGERTMPFAEFYSGYMETELGDGEVVASIDFDRIDGAHGSTYEKFANVEGGWATVGVGVAITLTDDHEAIEHAAVALSAVGDTPIHSPGAEAALEGAAPVEATIETAADAIPDDIDPLDDISGSAAYKSSIAKRLGKRNLQTAIDRAMEREDQ